MLQGSLRPVLSLPPSLEESTPGLKCLGQVSVLQAACRGAICQSEGLRWVQCQLKTVA